MASLEVKGFKWKVRRQVERLAAYFAGGTNNTYPRTAGAIARLRETASAELRTRISRTRDVRTSRTRDITGTPATRKRGRPRSVDVSAASRRHYELARRRGREIERLKEQLNSHTARNNATGGRTAISPEWISKQILTAPGQNARGLSKAFRDIVAVDKNPVSRPTIARVRGTWVEFYKNMVGKVAGGPGGRCPRRRPHQR